MAKIDSRPLGAVVLKVAKYFLAGLLLFSGGLLIVNKNPELYKIMPGRVVEGAMGDSIVTGVGLTVSDVFTLPQTGSGPGQINYAIPFPGRTDLLLYNDMRGVAGIIERGYPRALPFFDARAFFGDRFKAGNLELGLISLAFHPGFLVKGSVGEGKIYTVHSERPSAIYINSAISYFGLVDEKADHLSVLSEWTVSAEEPFQVDTSSQRIVLVLEQPFYDHNIYHIGFNPGSKPGESDYGMLYVGVGNGGGQSHLELDKQSLFGKILRIDPVGEGGAGYSVPPSNPFATSGQLRPEVWAAGFRNPQQFSWDPQSGHMYVADIGHSNIEEINVVKPGENYGWSYFEGRFLLSRESLERVKKSLIPLALFPVTFPVVEYDHQDGKAVAGGFVYRGTEIPELTGMYVFGDIVNGRLFYFESRAVDAGEHPQVFELILYEDGRLTSMAELVGDERVDLRLGLDARGELLLLNKYDNRIRRLSRR